MYILVFVYRIYRKLFIIHYLYNRKLFTFGNSIRFKVSKAHDYQSLTKGL